MRKVLRPYKNLSVLQVTLELPRQAVLWFGNITLRNVLRKEATTQLLSFYFRKVDDEELLTVGAHRFLGRPGSGARASKCGDKSILTHI